MVIDESANICLSGGAEGADTQWGMVAGLAGHKVIHWVFDRQKSYVPEEERVCLTADQLSVADEHLVTANLTLRRKWPVSNLYTGNLLRRNYYQVCWSDAVYAVAGFEKGLVTGGTAWAVQMFIDRFEGDECPAYVYDQDDERWFKWTGYRFEAIDRPPVPTGMWAGIGSRKLKKSGKNAIRELLGYVKPNFE